jgi:uncharacterized protein (DUF111 family)
VQFDIPAHITHASAYGAGSHDTPSRPNVLRLRLANSSDDALRMPRDEVVAICCNIDDCPGELLGTDFVDELRNAGAIDVTVHPVIMKKGRPGWMLEVLTSVFDAEHLATHILANTSTLGVRMNRLYRLVLPREESIIGTSFGDIRAKIALMPDGRRRIKPEFDSCRTRAREAGVSVEQVYHAALRQARPVVDQTEPDIQDGDTDRSRKG